MRTQTGSLLAWNGHPLSLSSSARKPDSNPEGRRLLPPLIPGKGKQGRAPRSARELVQDVGSKTLPGESPVGRAAELITVQRKGGLRRFQSRSGWHSAQAVTAELARLPLTRARRPTEPARCPCGVEASASSGTVRGHRIVSWTWRPARAATPRPDGGGRA